MRPAIYLSDEAFVEFGELLDARASAYASWKKAKESPERQRMTLAEKIEQDRLFRETIDALSQKMNGIRES